MHVFAAGAEGSTGPGSIWELDWRRGHTADPVTFNDELLVAKAMSGPEQHHLWRYNNLYYLFPQLYRRVHFTFVFLIKTVSSFKVLFHLCNCKRPHDGQWSELLSQEGIPWFAGLIISLVVWTLEVLPLCFKIICVFFFFTTRYHLQTSCFMCFCFLWRCCGIGWVSCREPLHSVSGPPSE